ncbi:hypothetical protein QE370_001390 [Aeromicrobium sp. SORGH_AS981]|uniref:hypothetical protein n=1 Tax=Aeromicrobium sp. SORGH_AS_0981 TaxID=3041802 RepID=UPI0028655B20|nr:hypothetical protein [Aeromicrobium sp. SORGH_AS_0981]MDR6118206.1 hypothetical protein [Aeromicrobium sp. SORGH_AS_0981]
MSIFPPTRIGRALVVSAVLVGVTKVLPFLLQVVSMTGDERTELPPLTPTGTTRDFLLGNPVTWFLAVAAAAYVLLVVVDVVVVPGAAAPRTLEADRAVGTVHRPEASGPGAAPHGDRLDRPTAVDEHEAHRTCPPSGSCPAQHHRTAPPGGDAHVGRSPTARGAAHPTPRTRLVRHTAPGQLTARRGVGLLTVVRLAPPRRVDTLDV